MAEKAVSDITDSGKELLEKLSDIEVFKREQQSTVGRVMEDLARAPPPKQLAVGGVAGWAAGYVTMKVYNQCQLDNIKLTPWKAVKITIFIS